MKDCLKQRILTVQMGFTGDSTDLSSVGAKIASPPPRNPFRVHGMKSLDKKVGDRAVRLGSG
jgi:hypothetical protein